MTVHADITAPQGASDLARELLARLAARPDGRIATEGTAQGFPGIVTQAALLQAAMAGTGTRPVAICAAKQPGAIAAVLAVLAAGRAYAPLDPAHPDVRILAILDGLLPGAVLVDAEAADRLADWAGRTGTPLIPLDAEAARSCDLPCAEALAAVLHTSGSTGVPKQVLIEAPAIRVFADWVRAEFGLCAADRVLSHAPLAFDLSFLDIFAALHVGADIVLADAAVAQSGERLARMVDEQGVTFIHGAPSALALMTAAAGDQVFPAVRAVLFAGEPMPADVLARIFAIFPAARVVNIYGCTETNDTFFYDVPRQETPDPLPLGLPFPYTDYILMTDAGHVAEPGEAGELWVRCPSMMAGYADPKATAAAFATHDGKRYFRSRDRVRLGADGLLHFLGRVDNVVKLRGYRIDLGEVETCLRAHPAVAEAAVFVSGQDSEAHLVAAISLRDDAANGLTLRLHAMQALPAYAIPKRFDLSRDPLPRNSNGKICRRILAARAEGMSGIALTKT